MDMTSTAPTIHAQYSQAFAAMLIYHTTQWKAGVRMISNL
jgi:hypothetical protein